ncbi:capsid maturation protease [Arthrobacter phage Timinator]|uniref:Capsid maturation protease n=3 Tax=Marthavirus barretlemon TaxID=2560300 RepID=A0A386KLE8_9CAUD|nr:capsid maturation protease [Arthrobacter phage Timinator]AYD86475.1 capsid maturation protease [Arthrobacter phage LeeroyJ]QJD53334.1 capsid maturation protease [Arthrobacter phage StevieBAY]
MCDLCTAVEQELQLTLVETELMLAEADAKLSTKTAVRPLTSNERRARVRFGEIDDMERTAESSAATLLVALRAELNDALLDELFSSDAVRPQQIADKLTTLLQVQPDRVQKAVFQTSGDIELLLRDVYSKSAQMVIDEARRQGSDVDKLDESRLKFADGDSSMFSMLGATVASYFWQRLTTVLQRELLSPATLMKSSVQREDVQKIVDEIDPAGMLDTASQAVHAARGAGRYDQAAEFEPEEIWASELMDGRTCRPCELVDGKEYATLAQARVEYEAGGYGACKGGARCRGTLVMIYGDPPERPVEPPKTEPLQPAPKKTRAPRKPKADSDALQPSPPVFEDQRYLRPTRPIDPDGRQRYISLNELPKKETNVVKPKPFDAEKFANLTPAKRAYQKRAAKAAGLFEEAARVNPLRGKADVGGPGYTSNCSNCVTAFELRRRGYIVQAGKIDKKGRYPHEFVDDWWKTADGGRPTTTLVGSRRGLETWAKEFPDGARGYVTVQWKGGGGHVFSWEKVDGGIVYIEPQVAEMPDAERHWARTRSGLTKAVRVDDLVPTDRVVAAVENAGGMF